MFHRIVLIFIIFTNLKSFAECNFKSGDFINELGNPRYIKKIIINTHKIKKYRENQLKILVSNNHVIPNKFKKYYKSNIKIFYSFGECQFKGKIRQHGDWNDHIILDSGTIKSSIRVNLETGNVMNAVRFSLLLPSTRHDLNEILGTLLLKNIGFITPETFQVKTEINGSKEIMLFQEVVRKELLERNMRREGPILEGDESILWGDNYIKNENHTLSFSRVENKKWFLKGDNSAKITLKAFHKLQNAYLEHSQHRDDLKWILMNPNYKNTELFSKYFFSLIALKGEHALYPHNRKFYYNTFTNKFEPIYYDGNLSLQKRTINNDHIINKDKILAAKNFYKIKSSEFKKNFSNLNNEKKILDSFYDRIQINKKSGLNFFKKSMTNIKLNENIIQSIFESVQNDNLWRHDVRKDHSKYLSKLSLLTNFEQVTIVELLKDKKNYTSLNSENKNLYLTKDEVADIISKNKLNGSRYVYVPNQIYKDKLNSDFKKITNFLNGYLEYSTTLSVKIDHPSKVINFTQNKKDDWVLFVDVNIDQWTILFDGIKVNKYNENIERNKDNENIERINNYGLTGCINFYQTTFNNSSIEVNNGKCEDSLNIINSQGRIKNVEISNSFSDGLDVDFSNIKIDNLIVKKSGNDCVDVSAGKYDITKISVFECGDKGISVGEKSNMNIKSLEIDKALIGLSSKDLSVTSVQYTKQKNVKNCFEVIQKKQEFGGSKLYAENRKCNKNLIDNNSRILKINREL